MKKALVSIILGGLIMAGAMISAEAKVSKEESKMTNKEKVVSLLNSIETGDPAPIGYINSNKYIQHNLMAGDGLQGFGELLKQLPQGGAKVKVIRAFQDGDYVFTHTDYDFFGPKAGFDIFRFEKDKIVEHWDNLQVKVEKTVNGHTMFDGPTEIKDLEKTDGNKTIVKNFVNEILIGGQFNKIGNYFDGDKYIQHNPMIEDGVSSLGKAVQQMAENGMAMKFDKLHFILGEGNFVLAVTEGTVGTKPTSFYDLFRLENSKITEHWDVIETIIPKEQWKNNNGKF